MFRWKSHRLLGEGFFRNPESSGLDHKCVELMEEVSRRNEVN